MSPQWVLDTNVVISGLLSPHGPPGRLLDAVLTQKHLLVIDDRIRLEYAEVLSRPKFRIGRERGQAFLAILQFQVQIIALPVANLSASEPDDTIFLEAAAASLDQTLVTGNLKHYPLEGRGPACVLSPREAWARLSVTGQNS